MQISRSFRVARVYTPPPPPPLCGNGRGWDHIISPPEFLKLIFNSLTRLGNFEMKNKNPALQVYYCKIFTQSLTRHLVLIGREIVNF